MKNHGAKIRLIFKSQSIESLNSVIYFTKNIKKIKKIPTFAVNYELLKILGMKQFIIILGFALFLLTGCGTKSSETAASGECCVAMKDSVEIIMNIPVKLKPEFISAYKAAFEKCRTETLKEEACMAYDLFQSYKDSTEFHLFERWKNKPGHLAHMETPHIKVYFEEIRGMQDRAATRMLEVAVCPKLNP